MSNSEESAKKEAAEHVEQEARSWTTGAEKETVEDQLREGYDEAGVDVSEQEIDQKAETISHEKDAVAEQ